MDITNRIRAAVRPMVVLYCTFILGILILLETTGHGGVYSEVGKEIVWAFIGITGFVDAEYAFERGLRHIMADRRKKNEPG